MNPRERKLRRIAAWAGAGTLALIIAGDIAARHRPHFEGTEFLFDTSPCFYPSLGFLSTVVLVLVARALGIVLSRRENYYGR